MSDLAASFLQAYDEQLRTDAETPSAVAITVLDGVRLVTFAGGRGFITYGPPDSDFSRRIAQLVEPALNHFRSMPDIKQVEWKSRGHDDTPGLHEALLEAGFSPGEPESIMIGSAEHLDVDVPLPDGVTLRQVTAESDVRAMCAMQDHVFGDEMSDEGARAVFDRLAKGDGMELWVAEAGGEIISAGRLEPVAGTNFAGIWGGATLEQWRGKGIYRALTAARARSALRMGKTLINSDSTEFSRPILERAGLLKVSTTTPYEWQR